MVECVLRMHEDAGSIPRTSIKKINKPNYPPRLEKVNKIVA